MFKQTLLIMGLSVMLSACGKGGVSDFSAPQNMPVEEVFANGCARCHGSDGGGMLLGLMYTLEPQGKTPTELATTILSGKEKMPAFANLSDKQRMELANYILQLRK